MASEIEIPESSPGQVLRLRLRRRSEHAEGMTGLGRRDAGGSTGPLRAATDGLHPCSIPSCHCGNGGPTAPNKANFAVLMLKMRVEWKNKANLRQLDFSATAFGLRSK